MAEGTTTIGEALGEKSGTTTIGEALGRKGGIPLTFGGRDVVRVPEAARPIFDFFQGFNKRVAEAIGAPIELIDKGLRLAGTSLLEKPGNATRAVKRAFKSIDIPTDKIDSFAADIGEGTFDGVVSLAALTAAAPVAVANTAAKSTTVQRVVNELGSFFVKSPGVAAVSEAGAVVGAKVGKRIGGPTGEVVGALAGGVGAGGAVTAVKIGVKAIPVVTAASGGALIGGAAAGPSGAVATGGLAALGTNKLINVGRRGVSRLFGRETPPEAEPIFAPPREGAATSAAKEVIERDLATAERQIAEILETLPEQTPETTSIALRDGLARALKVARAAEKAAFSEGFLAEETKANSLVEAARSMIKSSKKASPKTPNAELQRIINEFTVLKKAPGKKTKRRVVREVPAGEIQDFRSDLLNAARNNGAGPNPSRGLVRNLNILADAALDSLRQVDEEAVNTAISTSRRLNDLFFKGPIGRVMRKTTAGEPAVAEEATTGKLLQQPAGFRQIAPIAEEFEAGDIVPLTKDAIRATFRAAAEQEGKSAQIFLRNNRSAIESFADEAIKLQGVADELAAVQATKLGAQKGALARFSAQDPQIGISRIFSSANPAETATEIMSRIKGNPEALAGFTNEILAELFRRSGFSAQRLKGEISGGRILRLLESVLPETKLTRLKNLVDISAGVETGELRVTGIRQPILGPVLGLTARFVGAALGRKAAAIGGQAPTIQQTGAAATGVKAFVLRLQGKIDPADAFALAVADPAFERVMLTKVPLTSKELVAMNRSIRTIIATEAAARAAIDDEE